MVHQNGSTIKALGLGGRGFAVFPVHYITASGQCSCGDKNCENSGKHPMTASGFKDASTDPAAIERMFRGTRSLANIGVATGPASKVWVLDVEAEGIKDLDELQRHHGALPETVVAATGGGGRHYYFAYNGAEIRNKTKIGGVPIDVRGAGGYVVSPPSSHASGKPIPLFSYVF